MFPALYLPLISVMTEEQVPEACLARLVEGDFSDTLHFLEQEIDKPAQQPEAQSIVLRVLGDVQTAMARYEEAEESYRRSLKALDGKRAAMRIMSCRNAGWKAFFSGRLATAHACFERLLGCNELDALHEAEGCIGLYLVHHYLGNVDAALDAYRRVEAMPAFQAQGLRRCVVQAIHADIEFQRSLRSTKGLQDHAFWISALYSTQSVPSNDVRQMLAQCEQEAARLPVLRDRMRFLRALEALSEGDQSDSLTLRIYMEWAEWNDLTDYAHELRIEMALAALCANFNSLAEATLGPCHRTNARASKGLWYSEFMYCLAKLREAQGRTDLSIKCFAEYAIQAMKNLRAHSVPAAGARPGSRQKATGDDISARLPAKYRRAYQYLLDHLTQHDLSVREIANQIAVTERSLQAAFRTYLGMSPSQLIRQLRMRNIRTELMDGQGQPGSLLDVATRWGINNRSTLLYGYRKEFLENPSQTVAK